MSGTAEDLEDTDLYQILSLAVPFAIIILAVVITVCWKYRAKTLRRREEEAGRLPQRAPAAVQPLSPPPPRRTSEAQMASIMIMLDKLSFRRCFSAAPAGGGGTAATDCSVCLGEPEDGEVWCVLPKCGHVFHRQCMEMWFRTGSITCPLCRARQQLAFADMV